MELKQGSVVVVTKIIKNGISTSVYEDLIKMVGKNGVVSGSTGSNCGILYQVFFKIKEGICFYKEELEVIGVSNSYSTFCYYCGTQTKYCNFKNMKFRYCPKCLI